MFGSVIRKLSHSEEMFAEIESFVGLGAHLRGPLNVDALSAAFDALLQAHPVLAARLERGSDGRHHLAGDDFMGPEIEIVELADPAAPAPPPAFDQTVSLVHLRLTLHDGQAQPTLYVHHSLADGHHEFSLVEELFGYYTNEVCDGDVGHVTVQPTPDPLEVVLADRGIVKQTRTGFERFMPAMLAYELPPSRRVASNNDVCDRPTRVPMTSCRLTRRQTQRIADFGHTHRVSLNGLISAAILLAEWSIRGTPHIPVPYIYPVDLRYVLLPPVSATACTNPIGVGTYLAEIDRHTDVVQLGRDIAETFKADLADGVIQQSMLHQSPQYVGNPPGLPDIVMLTDNGVVPPMRTPPNLELTACHGELFFAVAGGIDMYTSKVFAGQLVIEHHSHATESGNSVEVIRSLLGGLADRRQASGPKA